MSAEFRSDKNILTAELFDGRLEKYNIYEYFPVDPLGLITARFLTDKINYLGVYCNESGNVGILSRTGFNNDVNVILHSISKEFNTGIHNDSEPQYWGFSSQDEWDDWQKLGNKRYKNNNETISMLNLLLEKAESGQLLGLAGVTFETDEATDCFSVGEANESTSDTIYELNKLQLKIRGSLMDLKN